MNWLSTDDVQDPAGLYATAENGELELNSFTFHLGTLLAVHLGVQRITEENATEVLYRLREWERLHGSMFGTPEGMRYFTAEDVHRHIGLTTNASPMSDRRFDTAMSRAWKEMTADYRRQAAREFSELKQVSV